jgi:hypothetical protein
MLIEEKSGAISNYSGSSFRGKQKLHFDIYSTGFSRE